jgi:hypothetical protein
VLFDDVELAQVVIDGDAGVVDEHIERVELLDCCLNMCRVRHVQCHGRHAFIKMVQCAASAGIHSPRTSPERLVNKRSTNASVCSGNQKLSSYRCSWPSPVGSSTSRGGLFVMR